MLQFLTLTLNPALDLSTSTEQVLPTHKLRCGPVLHYPGGGGINVARVLQRLGAEVLAWHLAGGAAGVQLQQLLAAEGLNAHCQTIAGDTRENLSVVERSSGQEYRFVMPGPEVQSAEWQACLDQIAALEPAPRWVIASGSLAPGVPDDFYAQLAQRLRERGSRLVIDSSGPALAQALQAGVYLAKPSLRELRELTGAPLQTPDQWRDAALSLVRQGQAQLVAVSLGEQGALLATPDGAWHAPALDVTAAHGTTGAGDCFLAGLVWALECGEPPQEALRWGVAAGTAALLVPGTALAQKADVLRLLASVPAPQRSY